MSIAIGKVSEILEIKIRNVLGDTPGFKNFLGGTDRGGTEQFHVNHGESP